MYRHIFGAALLLTVTCAANAQSAKVIKVSGRKAIVQTAPGTELKVGQTLSAEGSSDFSSSSSSSSSPGVNGDRNHSIGGSADFSSLSYSRSGNSSTRSRLRINARYGWNQRDMEYGPIVQLENASTSGATSTSLLLGGFFDYNFVPNAPGTNLVYAAGGTFKIGTSSSGGSSGSAWELFGAGILKWFPLTIPVAVRTEAGFLYGSDSSGGGSATVTGIQILAGFDIYY